MRKGSFSNDDLTEILRLKFVENYTIRKIAERMGCGKSTIGDFLSKKTYEGFWEEWDKKPHASAVTDKPEDRVEKLKGKRFLFVCAQNNTFIPENLWNSVQNFLEHRDAELIVGTSYYNKNGFQNASKENSGKMWFDKRVEPFIKEHPCLVGEDLMWLGELNILPTAVNPISGYHNYTGIKSGIIPHCKVNMQPLPVHQNDNPKFMYTTGSITYPNFIQKNAGNKAEHHHIFGGLYVEVDDDGEWFARQIQAESDTGNFYDLEEYFTPQGVEDHSGTSVEAINWGDLHFEMIDPEVALGAFGVKVGKDHNKMNTGDFDIVGGDNMLDVLKPKYQFCHDSSDFTPRNHHNVKDPHFMFAMMNKDYESVENGLADCAKGIASMTRDFVETIVVDSNHDRALMRWLKECDFRRDPVNAVFYLDTQADYYRAMQRGDYDYNVFAAVLRRIDDRLFTSNVTFLTDEDSFRLFGKNGIECSWHGDRGSNGSRGSLKGFTKTGLKVNSGHSHSAGIFEGHYQAGLCAYIPLNYTKGSPTSWSHSHIITYRNGKRAMVTMRGSKWRA
jgi:hypothetical protein